MSADRLRALIAALVWMILPARPALAQREPDPTEGARVKYGPIAFTPAIVFSTGYDTNVYREPTGFADYETFAVPQIEAWWKQPGFRARGFGAVELVHFRTNPGATNTQAGASIERLRSTVRPHFTFNHRRTNANPTGFEVGYKSLRLENSLIGGANINFSPRSELRATARSVVTSWDADAIYQSSNLREKLNRTTNSVSGGFAYKLTPLTAIGATTDVTGDRVMYSPERDGDTVRVSSIVEFAKPALLFGSAQVGYQHFTSPASGAANFDGIVGSANIGYGAPDGTLIKFYLNRDTQYLFDTSLAYYVLSSLNARSHGDS